MITSLYIFSDHAYMIWAIQAYNHHRRRGSINFEVLVFKTNHRHNFTKIHRSLRKAPIHHLSTHTRKRCRQFQIFKPPGPPARMTVERVFFRELYANKKHLFRIGDISYSIFWYCPEGKCIILKSKLVVEYVCNIKPLRKYVRTYESKYIYVLTYLLTY